MDVSNSLVIETRNLSKAYKGVQALKDLNLTVKQHSIFGFLGPNGAGKTTTIKLLLGLARPTGGSAHVFGHDIQRESVTIRKRVGYLAQDPRFYEHMTARETLDLVGLDDKADRPIKGFSGGERQRLGIAQAQINYPDLLFLDEPAASLDSRGRRAWHLPCLAAARVRFARCRPVLPGTRHERGGGRVHPDVPAQPGICP